MKRRQATPLDEPGWDESLGQTLWALAVLVLICIAFWLWMSIGVAATS